MRAVDPSAGEHRAGEHRAGKHGAGQQCAERNADGVDLGGGKHSAGQQCAGQQCAGHTRVDELCEQFILVCESAVDPLEISSALEFEGLSDQAARDRYGARDVFALAEEMYRRVPRRPAEPEQAADPWQLSKIRSALHGLLYGLPTACFPAATGLLTGRGVLTVLIVALLASWAISQALAYLGHARMGQAEPAQAARLLLGGLACGTAAVILATAVTAIAVHARATALVFGVGLGAYMVGATVLMVLGAERLLLVVLAPAVLGAASFLVAGRPPQLEHAVWGALTITPLVALGLAAARAWQLGRSAAVGQPGQVVSDLRRALPSAGFGLVAAGLLVFPFAASGHGVDTGAQLASLPLALSMGAAEWTLVWFRRRTQRLLRTTRELLAFAARARLALAAALIQYLSAATVLTAAVVVTATATGLIQPHWAVLPQIATYLALGGAMFVALLLQAFGVRGLPLITCAGALVLEVLWRRLGVLGQIVACAELFIVLTGYAALTLGRVVHHAC